MLSYPGDLDWSLCITKEWEKRTPFYSYVRPGLAITPVPGQVSLFPGFGKLPTELQIHVLSYCPARTLFQVMRVSSMLRVEAAKLFWANSDAWFVAEFEWLYQYEGYSGHTFWDVTFMNHVQQVELQYGSDMVRPRRHLKAKAMVQNFWQNFRRRFPNAKRVTINQNWEVSPTQDSPGPVAQLLGEIVDNCPAAINISVLVSEKSRLLIDGDDDNNDDDVPPAKRWQRTLYRRTMEGGWSELQPEHNRTTLLMPAKQFNGPIGEFKRIEYKDYIAEMLLYRF
jgi:hypothetical protein